MSVALYKIQQIKFLEEASEHSVSKNCEKMVSNTCRDVTLRGITPTLRLISGMAPVQYSYGHANATLLILPSPNGHAVVMRAITVVVALLNAVTTKLPL